LAAFSDGAFSQSAFGPAAFDFGTAPVVAATTPATGRSRGPRFYVEIDGQHFTVDSIAEAEELLQQARALAERQAEQLSEKTVKRLRKKKVVPEVKLDPPVVTASPELRFELAPIISDINRLYKQAAINAEIRLRLAQIARQQAEDEEEEDLLLLL